VFQYQDVKRDPSLYLVPINRRDQTLVTQLLLAYKLNPRTVLFAGYADNQLGGEVQGLVNSVDLTRKDRTFFLKVGYGLIF
jgi:hypothetical protein